MFLTDLNKLSFGISFFCSPNLFALRTRRSSNIELVYMSLASWVFTFVRSMAPLCCSVLLHHWLLAPNVRMTWSTCISGRRLQPRPSIEK
ncbi:hypothetical protein Mapa_013903 [Marchantia paleacea]|nr:hypothetical protein Mapa_013903 [Marchantia paleacea]